ncbi:branched-chain amino acid ABC transporter substrate-binding protein [Mesorhizobium sp. WSM2239]|uniref:Branched-chain amino acid ABC transporter substrate-binding protein n=2 Tax=unclassified Mesorhizobium TaxID=325217 RepID=A0AAU8DIK7_9HYPH
MRFAITVSAGMLLSGTASAEPLAIGVSAPLSGSSAILGAQVLEGASAAAGTATLEIADDACTAAGGAEAARQFVEAKVRVVVGFLCTEAIEAALPILKEAGIPVITVGVRTDSLTDRREKTGWPVFRLGPRADGENAAVAAILPKLWRDKLFAIIDDGTIYGRELAESVRAAAEQAALKPVFVDNFRPQMDNQVGLVGRLRRAGATHVFVGGDREDVAIMARDAAAVDADIIFAGGEALRAAPGDVPLAEGTLMIGLPEWSEIASKESLAVLRERQTAPDGYVLPAFAAVEIARAALADADATGKTPGDILAEGEFKTAIGPVRFDDKGDLADNPYRAFRYGGERFVPLGDE